MAYVRELADESGDTDVYLRVGSGPDLSCWSSPVPVADSGGLQTHHDISINRSEDPELNGRLVLSWYGTGNDPTSTTFGYFVTYSISEDTSNSIPVPVFKGSFKPSDICDGSGALAVGNDYTSVAFHEDGYFFSCWADNCFPGHQDWDILVKRIALEDCNMLGDEDGDGRADAEDPACCASCEDCSDNRDNDGDGLVDCSDPDCNSAPTCREDCDDETDNDGDGDVDCDDADCWPSCCPPPCDEICDDGVDNDGDGLADCGVDVSTPPDGILDLMADPDCRTFCQEVCTDGVDNDSDGLVDCMDPECCLDQEVCDDGVDNDCDGEVDCADAECADAESCNCNDGVDNDGDGDIDCDDSDCSEDPNCQ